LKPSGKISDALSLKGIELNFVTNWCNLYSGIIYLGNFSISVILAPACWLKIVNKTPTKSFYFIFIHLLGAIDCAEL
jgi:hypothetical protein